MASQVIFTLVVHTGSSVTFRVPRISQDKAHCAGNGMPVMHSHALPLRLVGRLKVTLFPAWTTSSTHAADP